MPGIRGLAHERRLTPQARGAERRQARSQQPRHAPGRCRLNALRARRAPRPIRLPEPPACGRARLSALHRGFPRAALGCARFGPGRASREREERALPDHRARLSQAPDTPTVVSAGSLPGPPGSGVTSPARRNRSRPISRLSPVTPLMGGMMVMYLYERLCQEKSRNIGDKNTAIMPDLLVIALAALVTVLWRR